MIVSSDGVRVAMVLQPTDATPITPVFTSARITSESLAFAATTIVSAELDPSAQVRDSILVGAESTGDLNLEISSHDAFDMYLEAVFGNLFATNVLIPAKALTTYLVEKTFPDVPAIGQNAYHRFSQTGFSSLSLNVTTSQVITGVASMIGGVMTTDTAIITGATYPPSGSEEILMPQNVTLLLTGIANGACLGTLTMNFVNGMRGVECIGTLGFKEKVRGRFEATISAEMYYANDNAVETLLSQAEFAGTVTLNDNAGLPQYIFDYPRLKVTAAPVLAGGTGTDVMVGLELQALYDETLGYTVEVTRA